MNKINLELINNNVERHPNIKLWNTKPVPTCSICRQIAKKCHCLCSCQSNYSDEITKLPSSLKFINVNSLTNSDGLLLHKQESVKCLELAKLLVLQKFYSVSRHNSLCWLAKKGGFYKKGNINTNIESYVVQLRRHRITSEIGITLWEVLNDVNSVPRT